MFDNLKYCVDEKIKKKTADLHLIHWLPSSCSDLKDRLAQQDKEWKELQQEKEALAIKFSKDPELIK